MFMPVDFKPLDQLLVKASKLVLLTHEKPDGDAIGSSLAMAILLEKLGKSAKVALVGPCPAQYMFLLSGHIPLNIQLYPIPTETDALLVLDTGTWNQLGVGANWLKQNPIPRVIIDHHRTQDDLGGPAIVNTAAEATAAMVLDYFKHNKITPCHSAATSLFTALAFDTGWFRHSNVTSGTFQIASELVTIGADPTSIYRELHQQEPLERMHLKGLALSSLRLHSNGKIGSLKLGTRDFKEAGCSMADSEGLSDLPRQISGVKAAIALFEESPGKIRVSLRSSGDVDVGQVAEDFGGGGHKAAAGCRLEMILDDAEIAILSALKSRMKE